MRVRWSAAGFAAAVVLAAVPDQPPRPCPAPRPATGVTAEARTDVTYAELVEMLRQWRAAR